MEFVYGQGTYTEGDKKLFGTIALGEHRIYLKGEEGGLAQTFIPLEKIEKIKKGSQCVEFYVRPSLAYRYTVYLQGKAEKLSELVKDVVGMRGLKKKFLYQEWFEEEV